MYALCSFRNAFVCISKYILICWNLIKNELGFFFFFRFVRFSNRNKEFKQLIIITAQLTSDVLVIYKLFGAVLQLIAIDFG